MQHIYTRLNKTNNLHVAYKTACSQITKKCNHLSIMCFSGNILDNNNNKIEDDNTQNSSPLKIFAHNKLMIQNAEFIPTEI